MCYQSLVSNALYMWRWAAVTPTSLGMHELHESEVHGNPSCSLLKKFPWCPHTLFGHGKSTGTEDPVRPGYCRISPCLPNFDIGAELYFFFLFSESVLPVPGSHRLVRMEALSSMPCTASSFFHAVLYSISCRTAHPCRTILHLHLPCRVLHLRSSFPPLISSSYPPSRRGPLLPLSLPSLPSSFLLFPSLLFPPFLFAPFLLPSFPPFKSASKLQHLKQFLMFLTKAPLLFQEAAPACR